MKNKTTHSIILALLCMLLAVVLANYYFQRMLRPSLMSREIQRLESFELRWDTSVISSAINIGDWKGDRYGRQIMMHLQEDQLILPIWNHNTILTTNAALTSFSLSTGEINWQTKIPWTTDFVGQNTDHIYAVVAHPGNEPQGAINRCNPGPYFCENIKVMAYNAQSGQEIWSIFYANIHHIDRLFVDDNIISVRGTATRSSYYEQFALNAKTGEAPSEFQKPVYEDDTYQYRSILADLGLDPYDIVGNYADNGDFIFFLTKEDSTLWAVEKNTSQIAGQVQFNKSPFLTLPGGQFKGFSVAVSDNTIIVYLGDSEQLLTFQFTPPE